MVSELPRPGELTKPASLRVQTPDGRLVVEFKGDGTTTIGDLPYPELVQALTEAFEPLTRVSEINRALDRELTRTNAELDNLKTEIINLANYLEGRVTPAYVDEYGRRLRALVQLEEDSEPRLCWCGPEAIISWPGCPIHGGALMREAPMKTHWRRLHDAFRIAQQEHTRSSAQGNA